MDENTDRRGQKPVSTLIDLSDVLSVYIFYYRLIPGFLSEQHHLLVINTMKLPPLQVVMSRI